MRMHQRRDLAMKARLAVRQIQELGQGSFPPSGTLG